MSTASATGTLLRCRAGKYDDEHDGAHHQLTVGRYSIDVSDGRPSRNLPKPS